MFWLGLATALLGGLFSIGLSRDTVRSRYKAIGDYHLDAIAIAVLLIGLVVTAVDHFQSERLLNEIKDKTSGRSLSPSMVARFLHGVANEPKGKVRVKFMGNNPEAADYAAALRDMLLKAGYETEQPEPWYFYGNADRGLVMAIKDNDRVPLHTVPLAKAFREIGLIIDEQTNEAVAEDEIFVEVGAKP
jgi:hypothetical protein